MAVSTAGAKARRPGRGGGLREELKSIDSESTENLNMLFGCFSSLTPATAIHYLRFQSCVTLRSSYYEIVVPLNVSGEHSLAVICSVSGCQCVTLKSFGNTLACAQPN